MRLLNVDACCREDSRTRILERAFLEAYTALRPEAAVKTVRLDDLGLRPLTGKAEEARSRRIDSGQLDGPEFDLARDFARADLIVISAPYWDFAFPASLKVYIEHICVRTMTFVYRGDLPVGLCRAEHLVYLTTAGSPIGGNNFGGDYIRGVTRGLLGVKQFHQVSAEGLDLLNADVEGIMAAACREARALAAQLESVNIIS